MKFLVDTPDQIIFETSRPESSIVHRYNFIKMGNGDLQLFHTSTLGEESRHALCLTKEALLTLKDFLELKP